MFMFDENGVLVSHPDSSLLGKNIADINVEFTNNIKNREEGFIRYQGKQGKEHFGAFTTNLSTGWTICTSINTSELDDDTHFIRVTTIFIILIMALISIGVAVFISTDISRAIHKVTSSFDTAAQGDLTVRVGRHRRDEFGKLTEGLDQMLDNVSSLLESVVKSADSVMNTSTNLAVNAGEVSTAVEDITKSVTELSQGAVSQAEDAQNGLIEMEKVSNQLDYITENSEKIHAIFTYTKKLSETGFKTIDTLTEKSEDAKNATNEVSRVVDDMYNSSLQISNISDALASITAQTNLLSLNAGIEAARAGDAGRGFSVVANEIRKLAEESKVSTEEIKVIIEGIQNKASQVAESIKVTGDVVKAQDVAVANTKEIFDKILTSITEMSEKVADISVAIRQTGENKNKLLKIIHNVSSVSQESAAATQELTASTEEINANVEEFAGYAEELKQLSDDLHSEIHKFQI
ncbi:MAG: methyl-accepting chemotaxis protein [Bacillota bacterium]|nr:methyl-accepting chemotaxis protein [Bacillota bacterium]